MKRAAISLMVLLTIACNQKQETAVVTTSSAESSAASASPAEPESKTPAIDACAVLTREEIVGSTLGELKDGPTPAEGLSKEKQCKYTNMQGTWLQTSLYGSDHWGLQKGITSEMHPKDISGLGDEAFSVKRGTDSVVYVRKGGGVLEVSCSCDSTQAQALAAKGAARI